MQEIGFSHLFHDLVDHICCDVEYQMQQGMSFDEAYKKVKAKIGFRGLKKIQEETLYAVDTKYRNMKKLMKISGVAGTIMLGFAAIFKISHWPFAGILLTLGAFVSLFFIPAFGTYCTLERNKEPEETDTVYFCLYCRSAFHSRNAFQDSALARSSYCNYFLDCYRAYSVYPVSSLFNFFSDMRRSTRD